MDTKPLKRFRLVHVNGLVELAHHNDISNAGEFGSHQFTPALDTEYLFYGHTFSHFTNTVTGKPVLFNPNLPKGGYNPAIFLRTLLQALLKTGTQISVSVINTGNPEVPMMLENTPYIWHVYEPVASSIRPYDPKQAYLQPNIRTPQVLLNHGERLGRDFYEHLKAAVQGADVGPFLVTECVPGGTLSAELWLRHICKESSESSSLVPNRDSLRIKDREAILSRYLSSLEANKPFEARQKRMGLEIHPSAISLDKAFDNFLTLNAAYLDTFQLVLLKAIHTLHQCVFNPTKTTGPQRGPKINPDSLIGRVKEGQLQIILGGGIQMLAPIKIYEAFLESQSAPTGFLFDLFRIQTTKWVIERTPWRQYFGPAPRLDLYRCKHNSLKDYEDGHVVEGVGAGAALYLMEQFHWNGQIEGHPTLDLLDAQTRTDARLIDDYNIRLRAQATTETLELDDDEDPIAPLPDIPIENFNPSTFDFDSNITFDNPSF